MIYNSKEEHELYTNQLLSNLAHDEKVFAMNNYEPFHTDRQAYADLLIELDDSIESLESVKKNISDLYKMIRAGWNKDEVISQFNKIAFESKLAAGEVIQLYGAALKAIEQLGGDKNV